MKSPHTKPKTLEECWKHIAMIEDAYHALSNDCGKMLGNKDLEMINKCKKCQRGLPR